MNQVRSWAKARHRRPAEKKQACGDQGGNGSLLVEENAEGGAGDPAHERGGGGKHADIGDPQLLQGKGSHKDGDTGRVP